MNISPQFVNSYVDGIVDEISNGMFRLSGYDVWYTGRGLFEVNGVYLIKN